MTEHSSAESRRSEQERWLKQARAAGKSGHAVEMLRALVESKLLDGLKRQLTRRRHASGHADDHPAAVDPDVDLAIAEATDSLFAALSAGKSVSDLGAYLVKVAQRRLVDRLRLLKREGNGGYIDEQGDGRAASVLDELVERDQVSIDHNERRRRAFEAVRALLPRLGHVRAQQVMSLILEAAEANVVDLPDATIAATLGIEVETAKKSRQRAFQRLIRIARDEGIGSEILASIENEYAGDGQRT